MSEKAYWHPITDKYMFVYVNELSDWANGSVVSETHWQKARYKGQSLSYVIIEESGALKVFGDESRHDMIGATMALHVAQESKGPQNLNMVLKEAVRMAVKENQYGPFQLLKKLYESKIGECPYEVDETYAFDQSNSGGPDYDEEEIDGLIDGMEDEIPEDNFVDEGLINEVPSDGSSAFSGSAKKGKATTKRPKRGNDKPDPDKSTDKKGSGTHISASPTDGYSHFKGGEGNLYIKGKGKSEEEAGALAAKGATVFQKVDDKMVAVENPAQQTQQPEAPQQPQAPEGEQQPEAPVDGEAQIMKVVDVGSPEHEDALKITADKDKKATTQPVENIDAETQRKEYSESLNIETLADKDKSVDQGAGKSATSSEYYTEKSEISDKEFDYANDEHWLSEGHRLTFTDDVAGGRMPMKELKLLERLANSKKNSTTGKIKHFSPNAGAGEIASQAGELCMQMFSSMEPEDVDEVKDDMISFLKENGDKGCLTVKWVEAAYNNSIGLRNYLDLRYGEGQHEMVASAWDTKEGVEAMIGRDIHTNDDKGYSTDVFFTVKGPNGNIDMVEISLKKDLGVKLLNSGPKEILDAVSELRGGDMDTVVFKKKEQTFLAKSANKANLTKAVKMLKDAEKNIGKYGKKQQGDIKDALKSLQKIDKGMNPDKIIEALKKKPGGSDEMRAAWKPMYTIQKLGENGDFDDIVKDASKLYAEYSENFFNEFKTNKKVEEAVMGIVRKELPLVAVLENEETLLAGEHSVDRVTMKKIFGTDDPSAFKQSLQVYEEPKPPFIGYAAAGGNGQPIPIALIRMRAEALGYGQRIKFDMDIHPQFADQVKKANGEVYGGGNE